MPATSGADVTVALRHVVDRLRRERIPYVLIGAWVLAVWGRPRSTVDLDLLVLVDQSGLDRLGALLNKAGVEVDKTWHEWNPMLKGSQLRLHFSRSSRGRKWRRVWIGGCRPACRQAGV